MRKEISLIIFLSPFVLFAQSITPDVIAASGTYATSLSGSMSWTIGETTTETYSSSGNFFTQGFHQPDTSLVIAVSNPAIGSVSIFPNPMVTYLIIDFAGVSGTFLLEIIDMHGNVLRKDNILTDNYSKMNIPFHGFANGVYFLNVVNIESRNRTSYKINKAE